MARDKFKNEGEVRKIGGKIESDYIFFKKQIEEINENFFGFLDVLGLTENIDLFIEAFNDGICNLCRHFMSKNIRDIEAGKIAKNEFLSPRIVTILEELPPEEREKKWERETKRSLSVLYKSIESEFLKKNGLFPPEPKHIQKALRMFGRSLFMAKSRIEIDGAKFIKVYESYITADESETKKQHEQAIEAINRFFNGIQITQEELSKYFVLEDGIIKIRIESVNVDDYSRLGKRKR